MMATILFFLLLSAIFTAEAQKNESIVNIGSFLTPTTNSSWLSRSGLYAFGFYQQSKGYAVGVFLAGIPEKTVVWTANRDDPPALPDVTLNFTSDGILIKGTYLAKPADQRATSASMLDSGNFVLYNSSKDIIWQSFDYPTDTIVQGQCLKTGKELVSSVSESDQSTGIFRLALVLSGTLKQFPFVWQLKEEYAYWSSNTSGNNVSLCLDNDGHLYLLQSPSTYLLNLTQGGYPTKGTIYLMRNDPGGIFRLYSHNLGKNGNWSVIWSSSNNTCDPLGLCGPNGFCTTTIDREANCQCLPGFASVNPGKWSSGCKRNFIAESCKSKDGSMNYRVEAVYNTEWDDNSYSVLSSMTQEDCQTACMEDCNCEAAMYKEGQSCQKQRLPLRFGKRVQQNGGNILFIKVGESSTINNIVPMENEKKVRKKILITSISLAAFGLIMLVISGIAIYRNRVWAYERLSNTGNVGLSMELSLQSYTYADLEKMTNGFKEKLGRGSFGTVYNGTIGNDQKRVAVKRLEKELAEGEKEFETEMKVIGRTHHRNLVRLLGYCHDGEHRLLVYEYMSNGSLADILFNPEKQPCWDERIEIARNIAKGILYLHEECESQIIHCDIKPQNILMNEYRCPKISDFGLAKLLKPEQTNTFTGIRGTKGYVAPEWHRNQAITIKVDVYSYGIVLLELICCRKSVDLNLPEEEAILKEWAYHCFEARDLGKLVSGEEVDKRQLERMVIVGLWCILDEPSLRPSMKKVLLMLEGTVNIPIPPRPTSFLSIV